MLLIECLLDLQKETDAPSAARNAYQYQDYPSSSLETNETTTTVSSSRQILEELKQKSSRKKCFQTKASVVFLPCGHLATCIVCSARSALCPICMTKVQEKIHAYIV